MTPSQIQTLSHIHLGRSAAKTIANSMKFFRAKLTYYRLKIKLKKEPLNSEFLGLAEDSLNMNELPDRVMTSTKNQEKLTFV